MALFVLQLYILGHNTGCDALIVVYCFFQIDQLLNTLCQAFCKRGAISRSSSIQISSPAQDNFTAESFKHSVTHSHVVDYSEFSEFNHALRSQLYTAGALNSP